MQKKATARTAALIEHTPTAVATTQPRKERGWTHCPARMVVRPCVALRLQAPILLVVVSVVVCVLWATVDCPHGERREALLDMTCGPTRKWWRGPPLAPSTGPPLRTIP
jgi:hypothetical protein